MKLRKGMDRRFRSGHPWVYSNELLESPKGLEPGACVELQDSRGQFLGRGFANPHSLISFRALTRDPKVLNPLSDERLSVIFAKALRMREDLGFKDKSCRILFGEADGLPGLIVDRYLTTSGIVWVLQAHTAGADRLIPQILNEIERFTLQSGGRPAWQKTAVVLRNDLGVRKLEGLSEQAPKLLKSGSEFELTEEGLKNIRIRVRSASGENQKEPLWFHVDLFEGQKTGFFLDQYANIELAISRLQDWGKNRVRILDLCSYVGQWGVQLGRAFKKKGLQVEVVAVDASNTALAFADKNLSSEGIEHKTIKGDVLKDLGQFTDQSFDCVISDPPALIKARKDIAVGTHAYLQMNTQAMRIVRPGGALVCCSCSGLMEEESFAQLLSKAAQRNQRFIRWVGRGAPSPDHPLLTEFPEGRYLKAWVGWVD